MTANEMFNSLGFDRTVTHINMVLTEICYREEYTSVYFYIDTKIYCTRGRFSTSANISPELHKAIHQQMLELGWI